MPYDINSNASITEISDAVNYLLNNFTTGFVSNPNSGEVSGPTGNIVGYLYKYIAIKYADSQDGSVNFSNVPTGRLYYGIRNNDSSVESTNPTDYIWNLVTGGFGSTKFLFYQTTGGRQIGFSIATTNPTSSYVQDNGTAIDLDLLTAGKGRQVAYPTIYQWTATITPPARPSITTTFTWATGVYTAPSSWTTVPLTDTTPGHYLWAITVPLSASPNDVTSVCDWTNVSYAIYNLSYNGTNGSTGSNGLNFLNAYLVQNQSSSAPTFTATTSGATIPSGWIGTAPAVSVGQVLWYIQGQYNSSGVTIDGVAANTTAWTGPIAASIFQDIRSDNWNGSNPPSSGTIASWGTTGYYISRTDGNMYANGFYARGVMVVNGSVYNPSFATTTALNANQSGSSTAGVMGYTNAAVGWGVVGWTDNASSSAGVDGVSTVVGPYGVQAANLAGGFGLNVVGKMKIDNSTVVTNLNANYLSGLNYKNVPANGTGTATFVNTTKPSSSTTNNVWMKFILEDGVTAVYVPAWQ
tara:strand:- start:814 stop:2382 length:1569 start_codon:yes stop_codon:yes gene_type:complete